MVILDGAFSKIRDKLKDIFTHIGVTSDGTAFDGSQTELDPANVGAAELLIKAVAVEDIDNSSTKYSMTIDGSAEYTGKVIQTIGLLEGATRDKALTRDVRPAGLGIGVTENDELTVAVVVTTEDNS